LILLSMSSQDHSESNLKKGNVRAEHALPKMLMSSYLMIPGILARFYHPEFMWYPIRIISTKRL